MISKGPLPVNRRKPPGAASGDRRPGYPSTDADRCRACYSLRHATGARRPDSRGRQAGQSLRCAAYAAPPRLHPALPRKGRDSGRDARSRFGTRARRPVADEGRDRRCHPERRLRPPGQASDRVRFGLDLLRGARVRPDVADDLDRAAGDEGPAGRDLRPPAAASALLLRPESRRPSHDPGDERRRGPERDVHLRRGGDLRRYLHASFHRRRDAGPRLAVGPRHLRRPPRRLPLRLAVSDQGAAGIPGHPTSPGPDQRLPSGAHQRHVDRPALPAGAVDHGTLR